MTAAGDAGRIIELMPAALQCCRLLILMMMPPLLMLLLLLLRS